MKSTYRSVLPWAFLEEYRGKFYGGEWPTLPELFRITVFRHGERACFSIFENGTKIVLTYREALAKTEAVARWLRSKGVRRGDKVAVSGKNSPEWAVAYLGVLFAGAVVVPIDCMLKDAELDLLLKTAHAKLLFTDEDKYRRCKENFDYPVVSLSRESGESGAYIYELDGEPFTEEPAAEDDLAAILFTSGTTGDPKGVMLSHKNLVADCFLAQGAPLDVLYTDVFYALLPIHHAYTMLAVFIETISQGGEVLFAKRMVVPAIMRDLKEGRVTMFLGVPMLFNKLLTGILKGIRKKGAVVYGIILLLMSFSGFVKKVSGFNPGRKLFAAVLKQASLSSIRICISGGGPLAPSVFRKYNQLGIDFVQGYGLTETSPIINLNPVEHYKEKSVGKVIPGAEMKILDPDGRGIGEVAVRGPMVMLGYYEKPDETAACFTKDGFFKTGDLGYLDSENYLYLTGRAKNLIVTEGGKNVYPEEIENEFQLFEEIDQILIRGFVQDRKTRSESIEAVIFPSFEYFKNAGIEVRDKIMERLGGIISEVNRRLLPYQKIEKFTLLDKPLDMTTTKKIKRRSAVRPDADSAGQKTDIGPQSAPEVSSAK